MDIDIEKSHELRCMIAESEDIRTDQMILVEQFEREICN